MKAVIFGWNTLF